MSGDPFVSDPPDDPDSNGSDIPKGRQLQPCTTGVLRSALGFYKSNDPDFTGEYFPINAARGYSMYGDVFMLDNRQAGALIPIMTESITRFSTQDGREKNQNINLLDRSLLDPKYESRSAKKAKMWSAALRDLCGDYGRESPV
jgi:hypothetical protein